MASVKAHSSNMAHANAWERLTTDHRRAWLQDGPRQPWKAKQRSVAAAPLTPGRATCSHHPAGLPAISDAYVHRSLSSLFASRPFSSYGAQQQYTGTHKRLSLPCAQPHSCIPSLSLQDGGEISDTRATPSGRLITRAQRARQNTVGVVSGDLHNSSVALRSLPLTQRPDPRHDLARRLGSGALVRL